MLVGVCRCLMFCAGDEDQTGFVMAADPDNTPGCVPPPGSITVGKVDAAEDAPCPVVVEVPDDAAAAAAAAGWCC